MYSPKTAIESSTIPNIKETKMMIGAYPIGNEFHHINFKIKNTIARAKHTALVTAPNKPTNLIGTREWLITPSIAIS